MSRRFHETPMDFEYANGTGPLDVTSPFVQLSQNTQRQQFEMAKKRESNIDDVVVPDAKRNSGGSNATGTPSRTSQNPAFARTQASPGKALPPTPAAFNGLFHTPRRGESHYDDSSAGETPKSPGRDDSEAPTPEGGQFKSALDKLDQMNFKSLPAPQKSPSPTKTKDYERPKITTDRRDSFWGRVKDKLYSPGRGEVPRGDLHHVKDHRVRKRRSRDMRASHQLVRSRRYSASSGEDADESELALTTPMRSPRKASKQSSQEIPLPPDPDRPHWITNLFRFIASHPTVPHILSFYAQLLFNLFLLAGCAYILWTFWSALQSDITKKAFEEKAGLMAQMGICVQDYKKNGCERETRVPYMETLCSEWEVCMNQDPDKVARGRVTAAAIAEIFTSFVEPISYKAMAFTFIMVFGCFAISNFAFGFFRDRASAQQQYQSPQYWAQSPPPPTPQHRQDGITYGTPWHHQIQGLEPGPSGAYQQMEGRGSPVRRLVYN